MYIVSACLLGINCKYNGDHNHEPLMTEFFKDEVVIPICPEQLGGLSTPRNPVEIIDGRVYDAGGNDFTEAFIKGAQESLKIADIYNDVKGIILKDGSPSCGVNYIYDGTFSHVKVKGQGFTARKFMDKNYTVLSEKDLLKNIEK